MTQSQTRSIIDGQQGTLTIEDTGYVAGIDIGGTNLRLALGDMSGAVVAKWSCSTAGVRGADAVMALIGEGVEQLLRQVSAPRGALKAVAAGAPGVTDVDRGIVIATSYLMGWRDVPLRAMLEDALSAPAAVDNDVNLAAIGESWAGAAKGARDFVFLAIGTGIGSGIVLNGRPFRGTGWAAGEIGYMLVPGTPDAPCNQGEPGALESMIGGEGIRAQWQTVWDASKTALPRDMTATEIFDHALAGDSLAQTVLNESACMLSHAIYNMNLVLNCPLFVLGGGVGIHPGLCDATRKKLEERNMRARPQLTRSTLGSDAQLMGALKLALETAGSRSAVLASDGAERA
ncbi:MAG: ROK family protein [Terracidiphilus sp.]|jgi:glucokinase